MGAIKLTRQQAVKELVAKEPISDQKELVERLKAHYGIETNQAAVSRDIRKLGIVKKQVNGALVYDVPETDVRTEILRLGIVDIQCNEAMIVITTYPGLAPFVGDSLDQTPDLGLLGCLAGENVIFVAPKSVKDIALVYKSLCKFFHFKKAGGPK